MLKKNLAFLFVAFIMLTYLSAQPDRETVSMTRPLDGHVLYIYCGAGMKNPFQEIADLFSETTGCGMNVTFANAAQIQTQIRTAREGDMFIAGSGDELKPISEFVASSVDLVKHIPVIAVMKGNPKGILGLEDMGRQDIEVITGDPDSTPIGKIAVKAFADYGLTGKVNIVANTATAPAMATAVAGGAADAAIVWKENCKVNGVEILNDPAMDRYIKTIPAATLTFSADRIALQGFSDFLNSQEAKDIWIRYGYELAE